MTKILTQTANDQLASQEIKVYEDVLINGISFKPESCNYSFSKDFGASSATVVIKNPNGIYSENGTNPINIGDEVIVIEGQYHPGSNDLEMYSGFTGFVRHRRPSVKRDSSLTIECVDNIAKLSDTDIDYATSGTQENVVDEVLKPNYIPVYSGTGTINTDYIEDLTKSFVVNELAGMWVFEPTFGARPIVSNTATRIYMNTNVSFTSATVKYIVTEGLAQVFDSDHGNWAQRPLPLIVVRNNSDVARQYNAMAASDTMLTEWGGFNIKYDHGQVVLGAPIDAMNYRIETTYTRYSAGKYAEDILQDLITTADGYSNTIFTVADHLTSKFSDESRALVDTMSPNYAPDTDPDVVSSLLNDVVSTDTVVAVRDGDLFIAPIPSELAYLQVGKEAISYEGIDGSLCTGIARGMLGTLSADHTKNDTVYQIFPAGQVWFTKFNNITTALASSDFTIPTGSVLDVDLRYGRIRLDAPIPIDSVVTCDTDYNFKTLQATGIQINEIEFRERDFKTRLDAIKRLKDFIAPNYNVRTEGDRKIWASYINQKFIEDYTLQLAESYDYADQEEMFTRVKIYGENLAPTNLMAEYPVSVLQSKYWSGTDGISSGVMDAYEIPSGTFVDNELIGLQLVDSVGNYYPIYGNTPTHLIVSGIPYSGSYRISRFNVGETFGQSLKFVQEVGDYYKYDAGIATTGNILSNFPNSPKIYLNSVVLDGPEPVPIGPVPVKKITDIQTIIKETTMNGQTDTQSTSTYKYLIQMPHTDIVPDIYKISEDPVTHEPMIDTTDDIFIYMAGTGGGGIKASIQFFANDTDVTQYVDSKFADIGACDPLFTIPINDPNVDYRKGMWKVNGIPSYRKIQNSLYQNIGQTDTTIYFITQKYYESYTGATMPINAAYSGTITSRAPAYVNSSVFGSGALISHYTAVSTPIQVLTLAQANPTTAVLKDSMGVVHSFYIAPTGTVGQINTNIMRLKTMPALGACKIYPFGEGWKADGFYTYADAIVNNQTESVYAYVPASTTLANPYLQNPSGSPGTNGWAGWLGVLFSRLVPEEYAFGNVNATSWIAHQTQNIYQTFANSFYSPVTARKIYNSMRWGGEIFSKGTVANRPCVVLDNGPTKEIITYTAITQTSQWTEFHDLRATMDGTGPNWGTNNAPGAGNGMLWGLNWGGSQAIIGTLGQSAVNVANASGYRIMVVNTVYKLTGVTRGAFGSSKQVFNATYSPNKFAAIMDGPTLIQKQFFYGQFPVGQQLTDIDRIGSAIYYVWHWHKDDGDPDWSINYQDNTFMIKKSMFADIANLVPNDKVTADFKFMTMMQPITNYHLMFDGRYNTQAQSMYTVEPLPGTEIFTIDFGEVVDIDAIDILGGYFALEGASAGLPEVSFTNQYTLKYSTDNITYLLPSDKAKSFSLASGNTFSLERDDLGSTFQARYLKLEIEKAQRFDYDGGKWFVSIADFRCWRDTILIGDATLVLREDYGASGTGTVSTFTDTTKSWTVNQFIGSYLVDTYDNEFYISANDATSLTVDGTPNTGEYWIFSDKQTSTSLYDKDNLRGKLGDKLYKDTSINSKIGKQNTIDVEAKERLREYVKNHSRLQVRVSFHPALRIGQTVRVIDTVSGVNRRYFIESISKDRYSKNIELGYYPA